MSKKPNLEDVPTEAPKYLHVRCNAAAIGFRSRQTGYLLDDEYVWKLIDNGTFTLITDVALEITDETAEVTEELRGG